MYLNKRIVFEELCDANNMFSIKYLILFNLKSRPKKLLYSFKHSPRTTVVLIGEAKQLEM